MICPECKNDLMETLDSPGKFIELLTLNSNAFLTSDTSTEIKSYNDLLSLIHAERMRKTKKKYHYLDYKGKRIISFEKRPKKTLIL